MTNDDDDGDDENDNNDNTLTNLSKLRRPVTGRVKRGRRKNHKRRSLENKVHKVLILGDSHTRGCASEVRNQLNNEYEVSGFINPRSEMKNIKEPAKIKMAQLTNDGDVVLWGVQMMLPDTILWWA
jgi:PleD family two-component response regulator